MNGNSNMMTGFRSGDQNEPMSAEELLAAVRSVMRTMSTEEATKVRQNFAGAISENQEFYDDPAADRRRRLGRDDPSFPGAPRTGGMDPLSREGAEDARRRRLAADATIDARDQAETDWARRSPATARVTVAPF
jgi:hypothetical protein